MAFRELKAIDVMSMATVSAVIAAIWGFFAGILAAAGLGGMMPALGAATIFGGFAAIIFTPIMAAIGGFVGGAITAFIYNVVAQKVGGVKLDL